MCGVCACVCLCNLYLITEVIKIMRYRNSLVNWC